MTRRTGPRSAAASRTARSARSSQAVRQQQPLPDPGTYTDSLVLKLSTL